jgi:predicted RND superfamily exporter protein
LVLGLSLVGIAMVGLLWLKADFSHRSYFWDDDPSLLRFDAFERRFGNDDSVVVAVHSPSGIFDADSAALLHELTERMWLIPEVVRVDSLSNYNWVHADGDEIKVEPLIPEFASTALLEQRKQIALAHEVIPGYLVSKDATTALVFGRIKPGIDAPPDSSKTTRAVESMLDSLKRTDHTFHLAGQPTLTDAFDRVATADMSTLLPIAVAIAAIFMALMLRTITGVLMALLVAVLGIVSTFGFAGWMGISLSNMSPVVPSIMIAVGIADTVHLLLSYYRARNDGLERDAAARYSLEKNLFPTFLTSFTTTIGFASFGTAALKPVSGLGWMATFGTQFTWLIMYLVLGALLFLLPLPVTRPREEAAPLSDRLSARYTAFLMRNRRSVIAINVLLVGASLLWVMRSEVNSDPLKYFGRDVPVRVANEFIEANVGAVRALEMVVDSGQEDGAKDPVFLHRVDALLQWLDEQPGVMRTLSVLDVLKQSNRSLHGDLQSEYRIPDDRETIGQELLLYTMNLPQGMDLNDRLTVKSDAIRVTILTTIPTSREVMSAIGQFESKARSLGLDTHVTGKYSLYQRVNSYVVSTFLSSFGQSIVCIGLLMVVFMRSLRLGIIAMIPNVAPIVIGGSLLRILGQPLDFGTVLVGSVSLGIAVDDTIHMLTNFRRLKLAGMTDVAAVRELFAHTAPALLYTTVILVGTFATFAFGSFMPNVYFGILTAFVLAIAVLVDLTLTPVLLVQDLEEHETVTHAAVSAAS